MDNFKLPKIDKNQDGSIRKAGFELEFSNINIEKIITILENDCSLKPKKLNNYLYKFDSKYGKYTLELDFELLTKQKLQKNIKELSDQLGLQIEQQKIEEIENFIGELSKDIVPYEISTPPIPIDKLKIIDTLVEKLSDNYAKGTHGKLYYAFGLHINLEVISLEADSLLNYLKAYVILQDYLTQDAEVDIVRKITPFIDNFPKEYIRFILQKEYTPTIKELIKDYLHFNPTRNRSLDMLPVFTHIDDTLVRKYLPNEKIKPRPTFHYRLSNSSIGEKDWKIAKEWNRWMLVEDLANDLDSLSSLSEKYLEHLDSFINLQSWESRIQKWIEDHS